MNSNAYSKVAWGIAGGVVGFTLLGFGLKELIMCKIRYDKDGFDAEGFNREGFDRYGFNLEGYDCEGYDRFGRDKGGFDRNGYDEDGYDFFGRDKDGYYRNGFARDGFNRDGLDYQGFGRDRYNYSGVDRAGCCRQFYSLHIERLRERLGQAFQQMQKGEYRYALYDARVVLEETIKLLVQHTAGLSGLGDTLLVNLKICEQKQLLNSEFIDRLHGVRKICNINGHEFCAGERLTHNKVYFVIMQILDLLCETETVLVNT